MKKDSVSLLVRIGTVLLALLFANADSAVAEGGPDAG
jgi:hypothetical protein